MKKIERLGHILFYLPMAMIVGMVLIEVLNIVGRIVKIPISGLGEITSYLAAMFISICIFLATLKDANVFVKFVIMLLPGKRLKAASRVLSALVSAVTLGSLAWAGFIYANKMALSGERTMLLNIPIAPIRYIFTFGLVLSVCVLTIRFFQAIYDVVKK